MLEDCSREKDRKAAEERDRAGLMRKEFTVHKLNARGLDRAQEFAENFSELLNNLESACGADGREMALVRTHLELASFYAKRAMASKPENQE